MVNDCYKIRKQMPNGEYRYSSGGMDPRWTTKGKTWSSVGYLKSHLKLHSRNPDVDNWEVIRIEMVETTTSLQPAKDFM